MPDNTTPLQQDEKVCDYCGSPAPNWKDSQKIVHYNLCDACFEAYDNKTGYCSLDCCISGSCDESC